MVQQVDVQRHQNARRTKAALQGVMATKRILQYRKSPRSERQTFHRSDRRPIGLHRQCQAGAGWRAVHINRAGTAYAMLAADVGAGHAQLVAQEVGRHIRGSASASTARPLRARTARDDGDRRSSAASACLLDRGAADLPDESAAVACGRMQIVARVEPPVNVSRASFNAVPSNTGKSRAIGRSATPPTASLILSCA